jgi:hypothetical protein
MTSPKWRSLVSGCPGWLFDRQFDLHIVAFNQPGKRARVKAVDNWNALTRPVDVLTCRGLTGTTRRISLSRESKLNDTLNWWNDT